MTLPAGWTVEDDTQQETQDNALPTGWSIEEPPQAQAAPQTDEERLARAEEEGYTVTGQFNRGFASGGTFGLTENVEALKPLEFEGWNRFSIASTAGKVAGSLAPLSWLIKAFTGPAVKLAAQSPVFQKQLSSLATLFGVGAAGATDAALHKVAKGEMPNADDMLENGLTWVALDVALQSAGYGGRFIKSLLSRSKSTGIPRKDLVNSISKELAESGIDMSNAEAVSAKALEILERPVTEAEAAQGQKLQLAEQKSTAEAKVAQEALKPEPVTPKDLKTRKITDEPVNRLTNETREIAEPYEPEATDFTKEADSLEKTAVQQKIDSKGERAASQEELGDSVKKDVKAQLEAKKEEYRPLYNEAEAAAEESFTVPQKTGRVAGTKFKEMGELKTKPQGYSAVLKTFENVLEDAGYLIQKDESGAIEFILSEKEVPVSKLMELGRRLNEMVEYEVVEPTVKKAINSVALAVKSDIRAGLAANPDALAAFELAEQAHAQTAKKFGTDAMRKIRGTEAGEKVAKMAESPSTFAELKEVLSPEQFAQLERETLEKLNKQNYDKAQETLRELERHMSADTKKLAREIVEAKNPHNPHARQKLTQEAVLDDMSEALTNGTRPNKTLQLWKTPKGQKLVKDTFHNSPNWPQVKNYLEQQSFNDMVSSVLKDGKLDLKKFKTFMRDPAAVNNIRAQGGEQAVEFFRHLDSQVKQLEQNVKLLDRFPTDFDIKKGKELIQKNAKEVSKGQRGKEILARTKAKTENQPIKAIAKEKLGTKKEPGEVARIQKETTGVRGQRILQRMADKDFPGMARTRKWRDWAKEMLGLNEQAAMNVFGVAKLGGAALGTWTIGIPNTIATMVGAKMLNKMLTSPRVRKAFIETSKHQTNPLLFLLAIQGFGETLSEEE